MKSRAGAALASALAVCALAARAEPDAHAEHAAPPPAASDAPRYEAPQPGTYELPPILHIASHRLLGASGKPEPLLALKPGELALVSFVYLSCGDACPLATALLDRLDGEIARQPDLAGRIELVTVSFDPQRDTPAAMRALRERLAPKGRWRFLTSANERALRPVLTDFGQDAVRVPGEANAPDALRHVLKIFVVDARGDVRQIYSTGFLDVRLVLADLRTLRAEASGAEPPPAS